MDGHRFDDLARTVGRLTTRRQVLGAFASFLITTVGHSSARSAPQGSTPRSDQRASSLAATESSVRGCNSRLFRLRAHNDAVNAYFGFDFDGSYDHHRVYLDTNMSSRTGYKRCGLGADYLLEGSLLWKYTGSGDGWDWEPIQEVPASIGASSANWTVPRALLKTTGAAKTTRMCFETEYSGEVFDTTSMYTHVYTDETAPVHAHSASNDAATIYFEATFDRTHAYKRIFIDTDGTNSGYQLKGIGANYLISNDELLRYTGIRNRWTWEKVGSVSMSPPEPGQSGVTRWWLPRDVLGDLDRGLAFNASFRFLACGTWEPVFPWTAPNSIAPRTRLVFQGSKTGDTPELTTDAYRHLFSLGAGKHDPSDDVPATGMTEVDDFEPDLDHLLRNPERGIYIEDRLDSKQEHSIMAKWLRLDGVCDKDLVWKGPGHKDNSPVLRDYSASLQAVRDVGAKVLFRPRYEKDEDGSPPNTCGRYHADSLKRQLNHIDAVAAMLGDNQDVIAFIQAGYLGVWGEWNLEGGADKVPLLTSRKNRTAVADRILTQYAKAGVTQHVEFRRPIFIREALACRGNAGSKRARVGLHDDCFMSKPDDWDMYTTDFCSESNESTCCAASDSLDRCDETASDYCEGISQEECKKYPYCPTFGKDDDARAWARSFTEDVSFGGETCPSNGKERWRFCSNMVGDTSEPASLHMSYLHRDWATDAMETWRDGDASKNHEKCYDEIRRRIGYRFELTRVAYSKSVTAGATFEVQVDVVNTGWANLRKPRQALLVLRGASTAPIVFPFDAGQAAKWAPNTPLTLSVRANAPGPGTYALSFWLPDPDAVLTDAAGNVKPETPGANDDDQGRRIAYAIKLATKRGKSKLFEPSTGENNLGVSMQVN